MNPALLAVLINEIAIPELTAWLRARHAANASITDADILQKLITDTDLGIQIGENWLATHPATPILQPMVSPQPPVGPTPIPHP